MEAKDAKVVVDLASQLEVAIKLLAHARRFAQRFEDGEPADWDEGDVVLYGLDGRTGDLTNEELAATRALIESEAEELA